ncbi:MAG: ATP-binding cassette domain-containing protein [Candidatus Kapabacteria bacterium]|nr:ATP-binding cassette domain-containing protein [Candidatus Kapabacteria bacterium]
MSILVKNICKNYGTNAAVNDISFELSSGEILGFLGPNGAGKTTTMKMISCFLPATSGLIEVEGLNVNTDSLEIRKKIGYLPEQNPLYTDMTVTEFLKFCAKLHQIPKGKLSVRLDEMLTDCGLNEVKNKIISQLSKGFKQRVGLAQALIHDPEVIILDEPTSGLDPNQIVEIRNLIKKLGKSKTVILSTHILSEVQATCSRVIIINKGKIVADSSLSEFEKLSQNINSFFIELRTSTEADSETIMSIIRSTKNIISIKEESKSENVFQYIVESSSDSEFRENFFKKVVENSWILSEIRTSKSGLEDVFHKLTQPH